MKSKATKKSSSPMIQQYLDLKSQYEEYILFFRMGDFYEMFFEDAKIASSVLDIALTKRGKDKDIEIPMCGVPHHSYESYLEKLIKNNLRVAICEQIETPEEAKKRGYKAIVKRDVVRVVTPGTLTEDNLLNPKKSNYLLSITIKSDQCAIAWVDISTGEFYIKTLFIDELPSILTLIEPQEILLDEQILNYNNTGYLIQDYKNQLINFPSSYFESKKNDKIIKDFYNIKFTDSFGELSNLEIGASGALISYIQNTQKAQLPKLNFPKLTLSEQYLQIDKTTLKSLEIFSSEEKNNSLFSFIDNTKTASGARTLRKFLSNPLIDKNKIDERLNKVSFFTNNVNLTNEIREIIKFFPDLERAMHKLLLSRGGARDWLIIINGINVIQKLENFYHQESNLLPENIQNIFSKLQGVTDLLPEYDIITDSPPILLRDGNFIKSGISEELDYFRNLNKIASNKIKELEEKYRNDTGINNLKIKSTNILGYYIEISKNSLPKINDQHFIHRQTLANNVRFVTEKILTIQNELNQATDKSLEIELAIFSNLLKKLDNDRKKLQEAIHAVTLLDIYTNLAFLANKYGFTRPNISNNNTLNIIDAFHPVVKNNLPDEIHEFTTNSCTLDKENFWLITGPNMAGKSTFLRQNALIIILAQIGSFVPAKSADIGIVDKIFSRVGASDDLSRGRSTFMVEMLETATILNNATQKSFLILDEIGRGTATFDGMSLALAIIEHIHNNIKSRTLFATHYHELSELSDKLNNCECYYSPVKEEKGKIIFTHKIVPGIAKKSYGIAVASLAGLPQNVINRANQVIKALESKHKIDEALQLPLFQNTNPINDNNISQTNDNELTGKQKKLFEKLKNLDIDQITPKQALEILYEYQSEIK